MKGETKCIAHEERKINKTEREAKERNKKEQVTRRERRPEKHNACRDSDVGKRERGERKGVERTSERREYDKFHLGPMRQEGEGELSLLEQVSYI